MCNKKKSIRREKHDFGPGLEWQGENVTTVTSLFSLKGLILWSLSTRMLAEVHSWALRLQIRGQCWHKSSNQHTDSVNTTRPQWKKKHDGPLWQRMIWLKKKNRFYYDYQELHSGLYLNQCWSGNIFKPKNLNKCVSSQKLSRSSPATVPFLVDGVQLPAQAWVVILTWHRVLLWRLIDFPSLVVVVVVLLNIWIYPTLLSAPSLTFTAP